MNYLHVINHPDEPGLACEVVQHGLELPAYSLTMPNYANFRLGKWEGSPCDTIVVTGTKLAFPFPEVAVYPNPACDYLMVEYKGGIGKSLHFSLFDVLGRMEMHEELSGEAASQRIDLSGFAPGLYFFKIERNGQAVKTGKVTVAESD